MSFYEEVTGEKYKKKKKAKQVDSEDIAKRLNLSQLRKTQEIAPVKKQTGVLSDETKQIAKDTVLGYLGNKFKVNEIKNIWSNGYQVGDVRNTINTVKSIFDPQEQIKQKVSSEIQSIAKSNGKLLKEPKALKESKEDLKNIWSNGYQFGDISKSKTSITKGISKTILGTVGDVGINLAKGELQTAEGLVDVGRYITSDVVKAAGYKDTAEGIRQRAIQNTTGFILGENDLYNNPKENGWSKKVDEYSAFGDKIDQINQSIGQQAFRIGLSKALMGNAAEGSTTAKAVEAFNQVEIFAGSYGQAKSEALINGADEKTANLRGLISGTTEWISENIFDSLPGFKTGELKGVTKLKNVIGEGAEKAFGKKGGKAVLRLFGGLGEGFEEILSNVLDTTFTDTLNYVMPEYTYDMKEGQGLRGEDNILWKQIKDIVGSATSEESKEAFITSLISTIITGAATDYANAEQRNQIIKGYAEDNNMSVQKATDLFDKISELRQNQLVDENTGFTERMETEENVNQQLQQEIQNGANLEELYKATPKTRAEQQFTFTKDELNNVKTEQDRILANSLENINNEKEVHDIYRTTSAAQRINKTQQYKLTTTEGLYQMGIINKTNDGKYVMPDGSEYVPRGLNYTDGAIYVNVDVGSKSATQAMYHEMFEGFKKASPKQYEQFKQMVTDIVGEDTIENEVAQYSQMYKNGKTNDVRDEIINDKFGELAENQKFINRLSDNRTLLEKFIDTIKNIKKYFKGTQQERELIKLQNKLEKEFAKRYKATDFSQNKGETVYSLDKIQGLEDYSRDEVKNIARDYINNTLLDSGIDAEIEGLEIIGSRNRGNARTDSDLDVVVELKGDNLREDDLFSTLNDVEDRLSIEGIDVDINPILSYESGTIQDYLKRSNQYDQEVMNKTTYSLSPKGEMIDSNGDKVTLEASEVETNIPVRDDAKLMAIHNLSQEKMNGIIDLGGLPVPSIAVTNPSKVDHSQYGQISLIFDKNTIDPSNRLNEVYDRDVWSPRFPHIDSEIIDSKVDTAAEKIGISDSGLQSLAEDYSNIDDLSYRLSRDSDVVEKYLKDNNIEYSNEDNIYKVAEKNGIVNYIKEQIDGIYGEKGIYNNKSYLTDSGNRRTFWQLHDRYNLDNLVKNMTSQETVSSETTMVGTGFGNIQANMSNRFNTLDEIRANESKIMAKEEADAAVGKIVEELNNESNELSKLYGDKFDPFWDYDSINYQLQELSKAKKVDAETFYEIANKYNPTIAKADIELVNRIVDTMNQLKEIPTDYFEAKPQRAVGLDEIQMAVIPNNASQEFKQKLQDNGIKYTEYDPSIEGDRNRVVNQFSDLKFSMTSNENIEAKDAPITQQEIAPIREDINNISNQLNNLSNQIETLQNGLENNPRGYVESYREQRNENIPTRQLTEDEANIRQEALMNDEGYLRSLEEQANYDINDKFINSLTNEIQPQLNVDKNNRSKLQQLIKDAVENDLSADEIRNRVEQDFSSYTENYEDEGLKEVKTAIRQTPLKVADYTKKDIADYGAFQKSNFGKMTFAKSGLPVDVAYAELSSEYPTYFPSDIINPTDQLLQIADVVNNKGQTINEVFDQDYLDNVSDYIADSILNYKANNQLDSQASLDKNIQFDFNEDIAPTTIRTQESIDNFIENRDIAPVRQQQTRNKSELRTRAENLWRELQQKFVNRNYLGDKLAQATGNQTIKWAGDDLNNVSGEVQYNINGHQTDFDGNWIGKGLKQIFEPARKSGLYAAFNDYLIQMSNIERHNVGKGSQVPQIVSQQLVNQYEAENPQFKKWAKDVYKYLDNVLQQEVDAGLITQEQYDNYRGEDGIYRSYVPFYLGENSNSNITYDDNGEIKSYSTLKKSKGNASDVNKLLAVEDALAKQTYAYKRAIRQNEYFKQIVSTQEKFNEMYDMDARENPTNLDDSLYVTEDGDKILTAYVDGEKVSAKISDELYNELLGENEQRIKQLEEDFSLLTKPLQKASDLRRKMITTWNPAFLARNFFKDAQDAVINSKHTAKMLKHFTGNGNIKKSAIYELFKAETKESQQFMARYGAELYGDYSGKMNKFTKLNELIELAPRFAEFKASLESGESIQQAIYNAREVTTNFGRGGYITKAMNRNGFTFLNANVQGLDKLVRNLSGENGVKGVTSVVTKGILFAVLPSILNDLMYGSGDDKDEEYKALPDYIKDNYYLIKTDGNHFVRIPKGRINAVFGSAARRLMETIETGENQFNGYIDNAWSQIGVGDLGGNNIFSPITQAIKNEAWYGGDIVPTRLQKKPASEQTDASVDKISNLIGETFNISPYKVNYVLDQYSGGIGDILLPMITEETTSGAETPVDYLTAPIKDAFSVNSTDDNKYAGEFYDTKDKLEIIKNGANATDDDVLRYKYMSGVSTQLSDLYKERREVQADTTLSNKEKYAKVQKIQDSINSLAKEAMSEYKNIHSTENYSSAGDGEFYKNNKEEWTTVKESDSEFTAGMTDTEKSSYYKTKNKINAIYDEYNDKVKELSKKDSKREVYAKEKRDGISQAIINSGLDDYSKAMIYSKYYSSEEHMNNVVNAGYDVDTYITALNDLDQIRDKYSQKKGYTTEQRKNKTISYINSLNMEIPQKAMLIREYYTSFRDYNKDIVNYVSNLNISYEEKVSILEDTNMTVNGNNVSWK